jgi:hypothetical protein
MMAASDVPGWELLERDVRFLRASRVAWDGPRELVLRRSWLEAPPPRPDCAAVT